MLVLNIELYFGMQADILRMSHSEIRWKQSEKGCEFYLCQEHSAIYRMN